MHAFRGHVEVIAEDDAAGGMLTNWADFNRNIENCMRRVTKPDFAVKPNSPKGEDKDKLNIGDFIVSFDNAMREHIGRGLGFCRPLHVRVLFFWHGGDFFSVGMGPDHLAMLQYFQASVDARINVEASWDLNRGIWNIVKPVFKRSVCWLHCSTVAAVHSFYYRLFLGGSLFTLQLDILQMYTNNYGGPGVCAFFSSSVEAMMVDRRVP